MPHPEMLERARLGQLVRQLGDALPGRARVSVRVDAEDAGSEQLPADVGVAAYRIAQECLANVARHSGASTASTELHADTGSLSLRVADDGRGFDPAATAGGMGLMGMRERAELAGGTLRVQSRPGAGSEVTFRWEDPR